MYFKNNTLSLYFFFNVLCLGLFKHTPNILLLSRIESLGARDRLSSCSGSSFSWGTVGWSLPIPVPYSPPQ